MSELLHDENVGSGDGDGVVYTKSSISSASSSRMLTSC